MTRRKVDTHKKVRLSSTQFSYLDAAKWGTLVGLDRTIVSLLEHGYLVQGMKLQWHITAAGLKAWQRARRRGMEE
jgi:hypothetical protein